MPRSHRAQSAASKASAAERAYVEPFLFTKVEKVPTTKNAGATFQRETIKNEGQ